MISWQAVIKERLIDKGLKDAAIIGHPDGGVWAASDGHTIKSGEGQEISSFFSNFANTQGQKITYGGVKYMRTNSNEDMITGRKGTGGVILFKTYSKAIIIGIYDETLDYGKAMDILVSMGDYMGGLEY